MALIRYGLGAAMIIAGIVMAAINPGGFGVDGFAMAVGGGLSVLLINFLFRLGVSSDQEREREEEARRYLEEHGVWPDEVPDVRGPRWTLAPGAVTAAQEAEENSARRESPVPGAGRRE
jgi:small neutral amino acid transporter SnatA (MarC family)